MSTSGGQNSLGADQGTLTIGPNVLIHGASGNLGSPNLPLINLGTISADVAGGTIVIRGSPFTNLGQTNSLNGGILLVNP